jgi:aldehyde:ferredoxin oxidoreductase
MTTLAGKLLRINLSNKTYKEEEIQSRLYEHFISARGLGAKYLYDELSPNTNPLSPENRLLFLIGALGGTGLQGFSKWVVMSKSPLTGTIMRSYTGGNFGVWMKFAGYDLVIIEGKADVLSYIYIDKDDIRIIDAKDLKGLDPRNVQRKLKEKHGPKTESACIGIGGENLTPYAVVTSGERTASRGGMGAVMGSKNLKAVAINTPIKNLRPFDANRFKELVKAQTTMLKDHPRRKAMNTVGTPYITTVLMKSGIMPVNAFREGGIENVEAISGNEFLKLKKMKAGCYGCMTRCGGLREVYRGPYKGTLIDGPEYETIYAFGPLLNITDKQFIIDANAACDYYGIDTISAGVCIAFAFELFEKGVITAADTDGLNLTWGNQDAVLILLEKISKREGFGELLSQGVKKMADHFGHETSSYAIHIKGLEMPGYEPRAVKGYALSMATSNIGASHMYGRPRTELAGKLDPFSEKDKGVSIAQVQKEQAVEDSLIACTFGNSGLDLQNYSDYLVAATGIEAFNSPDNLLKIGERIICLERCFNVREGFSRKDDVLPKRMSTESLKNAGPAENQVVENLDALLDEYYNALGYTKEGVPTEQKLAELGIA